MTKNRILSNLPNTIGAAAFCDIGTTEGTVAAGNDERFLGTRRVIRRIIQHDTQSPIVLVEKPDGWVVECVQAGIVRMFVNGNQVAGTYTDTSNYSTPNPVSIGVDNSNMYSFPFNGRICDMRYTRGVARQVTNFVVPNSPTEIR